MRQYTFTENGFTFERVDKRQARKAYNNGLRVVVCPVNLRPGYPWHPEISVSGKSGATKRANMPPFISRLCWLIGSRAKSPRRQQWERLNSTIIVIWRAEQWVPSIILQAII